MIKEGWGSWMWCGVMHVFCIPAEADLWVAHFECSLSLLCLQAVAEMGPVGLVTRGLPLRIVMIGALTGAQWAIYDSFKVVLGQ